jgi:hypothetical protein
MDLYLHIGFPKTATTFLQTIVFPKLNSENFVYLNRKDIVKRQKQHSSFFNYVAGKGFSIAFTRSPDFWKRHGDEFFNMVLGVETADRFAFKAKQNLLISFEGITDPSVFAAPAENRPRKDPYLLKMHLQECKRIALDKGFSDVKVLLTIREQAVWLASMYAQTSDRNPEASQTDFEKQVRDLLDPAHKFFISGLWLDYLLVYQQISDAIGEKNILVLPQEMLQQDQQGFFKLLLEFLNIDSPAILEGVLDIVNNTGSDAINSRRSSQNTWQLRKSPSSSIFPKFSYLYWLMKGVSISSLSKQRPALSISLTDSVKSTVSNQFRLSNISLEKEIRLNLKQYQYY